MMSQHIDCNQANILDDGCIDVCCHSGFVHIQPVFEMTPYEEGQWTKVRGVLCP